MVSVPAPVFTKGPDPIAAETIALPEALLTFVDVGFNVPLETVSPEAAAAVIEKAPEVWLIPPRFKVPPARTVAAAVLNPPLTVETTVPSEIVKAPVWVLTLPIVNVPVPVLLIAADPEIAPLPANV